MIFVLLEMNQKRYDCPFTPYSLFLAVTYTILLVVSASYLIYLLRKYATQQRIAHKAFLVIICLVSISRSAYFFAWPFVDLSRSLPDPPTNSTSRLTNLSITQADYNQYVHLSSITHDVPIDIDSFCPVSLDDGSTHWLMALLGSVPVLLFLSGFSIHVHTFAHIYHRILYNFTQSRRHTFNLSKTHSQRLFWWLKCGLIFFNLISYVLAIVTYVLHIKRPPDVSSQPSTQIRAYFWCVALAVLALAVLFVLYAYLLFKGMAQQPPTFAVDDGSLERGGTVYPLTLPLLRQNRQNALKSLKSNPMGRLFVAAIVVFCCLLTRATLLPVVMEAYNGKYDNSVLVFYLVVSEVVPVVSMLSVFDMKTGQQQNNPPRINIFPFPRNNRYSFRPNAKLPFNSNQIQDLQLR